MKKKELNELRAKEEKELVKLLGDKKMELIKLQSDTKTSREKNFKKAKIIRRDVAQILTIIREAQIISSEKEVKK